MSAAQQIIAALDLKPLPREGGYYRETYRSSERIEAKVRSLCTAIYYLLTPDTRSALHRLPSDEIFHFYLGDPVEMLHLYSDGTGRVLTLGNDVLHGQTPQILVPAGTWQGSRLVLDGEFALLGTTMAPGFDFVDYESADSTELAWRYSQYADRIELLSKARDSQ
jgi:predicted cupin superfamily sugar epimerase